MHLIDTKETGQSLMFVQVWRTVLTEGNDRLFSGPRKGDLVSVWSCCGMYQVLAMNLLDRTSALGS